MAVRTKYKMGDGVEGHVVVEIANVYREEKGTTDIFFGMDRSYNVKAPG